METTGGMDRPKSLTKIPQNCMTNEDKFGNSIISVMSLEQEWILILSESSDFKSTKL